MAADLQARWDAFLRSLGTARLGEVRKTTTPRGLQWVESFLNPDEDGFEDRCRGLASGWARRVATLSGASADEPMAILWVPFWCRAFFLFGPRIIVQFKATEEGLRVDGISFMGD